MTYSRFGKNSSGSDEPRPYFTKLFSCHSRRAFDDAEDQSIVRRQTFDLQRSLYSEPTTAAEQASRRRPKLDLRSLNSSCSLKPSPTLTPSPSPPPSYKPELTRPSSVSPVSCRPPTDPIRRGSSRLATRHSRSRSNGSVNTAPIRQHPPILRRPWDHWRAPEEEEHRMDALTDEIAAWLSSLAESSSRARARHVAGLSPKLESHRGSDGGGPGRQRVGWDLQARRSSSSCLVGPRSCTVEGRPRDQDQDHHQGLL
ncbi:hypothetical protein CROQUDRAFT_359162 [Cronartium quercuum f. sp. fusiforme G11]|uniref:Uncharacterized protein n=1 Tax=Cronartium quercuum f. sp. fusiforme G11 TaxID=708437 RepID=A0A9P6NRL7_9BASI|nr:hypothetical protein CROQUDRAFT_359162 [Cronartium quercuum f. sp. fusiforme G11]